MSGLYIDQPELVANVRRLPCERMAPFIHPKWLKIMKEKNTFKRKIGLKLYFRFMERFNKKYKCGWDKDIEQIKKASYPKAKKQDVL